MLQCGCQGPKVALKAHFHAISLVLASKRNKIMALKEEFDWGVRRGSSGAKEGVSLGCKEGSP